jgi:hypothetical protein
VSPSFLRFAFPSEQNWTDASIPPVELARRLANLIESADPKRISVAHINWAIRETAPDPGDLGYAGGEAMPSERINEWLAIHEGPDGRKAYLEIDLQEFGRWKAAHP